MYFDISLLMCLICVHVSINGPNMVLLNQTSGTVLFTVVMHTFVTFLFFIPL